MTFFHNGKPAATLTVPRTSEGQKGAVAVVGSPNMPPALLTAANLRVVSLARFAQSAIVLDGSNIAAI